MPADLFTPTFFTRVHSLMSPSGVLAVNDLGKVDGNMAAVLCALRSSGFSHARAFAEQTQGGRHVSVSFKLVTCIV